MTSPRTPQSSLSAELKELINERNMLTTRTRMKVLNALDGIQNQSINKREQRLRAQVIHEILTSEVTYLKNLEIIMEYFMRPICERQLLSHSSYTTLFENIETLYNVNAELLKELKQDPENIATAFFKLAPFFKLYSVYAYNYKRALDLLQEIQNNNPKTAEFIANQETRPEVSNTLSSLLITPIQRVPRYKLLLKEVLRHTSSKEKDYNILQGSLVQIENVAAHINSLVEEYEETQKLLDLQKHIVSPVNLVKPGRKLIRQGPLMRVSRRGNSSFKRHFVLLSDTLLYCKGDPNHSLTVCCLLPLKKCKIERVLSNGLFRVVCLQEILLLYSENGDSEAWIQSLQQSVKKYMECRQTLRKDSSSRVPVRNVNQFPSENILTKRCKRKRSANQEEAVTHSSKVIYINRDIETDTSSEGPINCFPIVKKLKTSTPDDMTMNEKIKVWMDGLKSRQLASSSEQIPSLSNSLPTVEENPSLGYSNEGFSNFALGEDFIGFDENATNLDVSEIEFDAQSYRKKFEVYSGTTTRQNEPPSFSFRKICTFISTVRTSLRDLFYRK